MQAERSLASPGGRIATALVLAPLVLGAVFLGEAWLLAGLLAAFALLGAWEWAGLCGWRRPTLRLFYVAGMAGLLAVAWLGRGHAFAWPTVAAAACGWGLFCAVLLGGGGRLLSFPVPGLALAAAGYAVLLPAWLGLLLLQHDFGTGALAYLFLLVWAVDSAAWYVGRRWGRRRLAPAISPGKTWVGVLGAAGAALLLAACVSPALPAGQRAAFVGLSLLVPVAAVVGDLAESALKRRAGRKDSGRLLPGHGGILDRIDGLVAAAPPFAAGMHWLGEGG